MRRYVTELVGTFFLVLTVGLTALGGTLFAPLAIAAILMVMVYMGGHVSGAHYNPAVSLGAFVRGKLSAADLTGYVTAQVLAGLAAGVAVLYLTGSSFAPGPGPELGVGEIFVAELLFTFALVLVVLHTAMSDDVAGNSYYGLAIGFTVGAGAWAVGPISGAAFNPAVALGPTLLHAGFGEGGWGALWIYLTAPFLGGLAAAWLHGWQQPAQGSP